MHLNLPKLVGISPFGNGGDEMKWPLAGLSQRSLDNGWRNLLGVKMQGGNEVRIPMGMSSSLMVPSFALPGLSLTFLA